MRTIFIYLFLFARAFAQTNATTDDGRKVLLFDDGTWKIAPVMESAQNDSTDFRKAKWGMSKTTIKNLETAKLYSEEAVQGATIYDSKVAGFDCLIGYFFAEDKLVRGRYIFIQQHTNKNEFIFDYESIKTTIIEKYGTPKKEKTTWLNRLYADNIEQHGLAVSMGHLYYYTTWETPTTEIYLELSGDNFEIKLIAEYTSIKLKHLAERAKQNKKSDF